MKLEDRALEAVEGIGPVYRKKLESRGISNLTAFLRLNAHEIDTITGAGLKRIFFLEKTSLFGGLNGNAGPGCRSAFGIKIILRVRGIF